jgi:hypothetical protein
MFESTEIRRHANGSIDVEHYARIGRALHGQAIRDAGRGLAFKLQQLIVTAWMHSRAYRNPSDHRFGVAPAE